MKRLLLLFTFLSISINSFAQTLISNYTVINGHKLHYYKSGNGSPLILLTGYGVTSNFWSKPFVNCLSQNHTVYLLDYQGINTTEAANPKLTMQMLTQDLHSFIKQLKLNKPDLIGWSMGGAIALSTAIDYPQDLSTLNLISPAIPNKLTLKRIPKHGVFKSNDDVLNYVFNNDIYLYQPNQLPNYKQQILFANQQLFPDHDQNKLEIKVLESWIHNQQASTQIANIKLPIKLILSENDAILNPQIQLEMFKKQPNTTTYMIKNSGHAPFYQYPENVCKIILK